MATRRETAASLLAPLECPRNFAPKICGVRHVSFNEPRDQRIGDCMHSRQTCVAHVEAAARVKLLVLRPNLLISERQSFVEFQCAYRRRHSATGGRGAGWLSSSASSPTVRKGEAANEIRGPAAIESTTQRRKSSITMYCICTNICLMDITESEKFRKGIKNDDLLLYLSVNSSKTAFYSNELFPYI